MLLIRASNHTTVIANDSEAIQEQKKKRWIVSPQELLAVLREMQTPT
jgi:hypothetical protein